MAEMNAPTEENAGNSSLSLMLAHMKDVLTDNTGESTSFDTVAIRSQEPKSATHRKSKRCLGSSIVLSASVQIPVNKSVVFELLPFQL